jgi:uncharacterized SAM-binding protein YcdF (DUF218 family)
MAFLDVVTPGVASHGPLPQIARLADRLGTPKATTVRWMLRLITFLLMFSATIVGVQLAMSAPSVSPVALSNPADADAIT